MASTSRTYANAAHRFLRNPNLEGSIYKRVSSRPSAFENTLTVLEDPKTGRKVYLIGTTNSSTVLAKRTEKLIEALKPESLHVQTCLPWFERVRRLELHNQEQLNGVNSGFNDVMLLRVDEQANSVRGLYFKARFYGWMFFMQYYLGFPANFNPWRPGVEMLWGIQAAERLGARVSYLGAFFNASVVGSMLHENNIGVAGMLRRLFRGESFSRWRTEARDFFSVLQTTGGPGFSESLDLAQVSWFVKWYERLHPELKHILVDKEDTRIFQALFRERAKTTVAVVNHWHLPGVRAHWEAATGTAAPRAPINPIGDMDIDQLQEANLVNALLRAEFAARRRSEPAAWANYLTHYKKSAMEPERERHVFFAGCADHHLEHGLFNGENEAARNHQASSDPRHKLH